MNEPLSEVIRIRVTPSHAARLGEAAALSALSLSNYIRRRLSADDTLQEEPTLLRQIVTDLGHLRDTRQAVIETVHLVHGLCGEFSDCEGELAVQRVFCFCCGVSRDWEVLNTEADLLQTDLESESTSCCHSWPSPPACLANSVNSTDPPR